jgi:ABC-type transport system involved in cytochrome c biogenesis permease subunit
MFAYTLIALSAIGTLVWRHPLADVSARAAAPLGAGFTAIALITGSLWGKPMWGTWWVWDARLTSVLILFLMYLGLIALWRAFDDPAKGAKAAAILALGRLHQCAHHQVFGRLVEHAASTGQRVPHGWPDHPSQRFFGRWR